MKKFVVIALVLLLMLFVSSCAGNKEDENKQPENDTAESLSLEDVPGATDEVSSLEDVPGVTDEVSSLEDVPGVTDEVSSFEDVPAITDEVSSDEDEDTSFISDEIDCVFKTRYFKVITNGYWKNNVITKEETYHGEDSIKFYEKTCHEKSGEGHIFTIYLSEKSAADDPSGMLREWAKINTPDGDFYIVSYAASDDQCWAVPEARDSYGRMFNDMQSGNITVKAVFPAKIVD